jgi:hypothetical protein
MTLVPVAPLRERYGVLLARGESPSMIAERAGFMERGRPDTTRLQRRLGVRASSGYVTRSVEYRVAVVLAEALLMDPHEAGI